MVQKSAGEGDATMKKMNFLGLSCTLTLCSLVLYLFSQFILIPYNTALQNKADLLSVKTQTVEKSNDLERNNLITLLTSLGFEISDQG